MLLYHLLCCQQYDNFDSKVASESYVNNVAKMKLALQPIVFPYVGRDVRAYDICTSISRAYKDTHLKRTRTD